MSRLILVFFVGSAFGICFGVGVGIFAFPYVFPPPKAIETLTAEEKSLLVARGKFLHVDPSDTLHYGKGNVSVFRDVVYFDSDFEVSPGPALRVYLVAKGQIRKSATIKNSIIIDLGNLRSFKGSQKYSIPTGIKLKDYPSVVIWCERFDVLFSTADLKSEM